MADIKFCLIVRMSALGCGFNRSVRLDYSQHFIDWLPSAMSGRSAQTKTAPEGAAIN